MCSKCAGGPFGCYCDGKGTFAVCPVQKGIYCPACEHYPGGLNADTYKGPWLEDLIAPELIQQAREAYLADADNKG